MARRETGEVMADDLTAEELRLLSDARASMVVSAHAAGWDFAQQRQWARMADAIKKATEQLQRLRAQTCGTCACQEEPNEHGLAWCEAIPGYVPARFANGQPFGCTAWTPKPGDGGEK